MERPLLEALVHGVMVERGKPEAEAREMAKAAGRHALMQPPEVAAVVREISSVLLTLHAHGKLRDV